MSDTAFMRARIGEARSSTASIPAKLSTPSSSTASLIAPLFNSATLATTSKSIHFHAASSESHPATRSHGSKIHGA